MQKLKEMIPQITVSDDVALGHMMDIITQTRKESRFALGVPTRGAIALYKSISGNRCLCWTRLCSFRKMSATSLRLYCGHGATVNGTVRPGEIEKYFQEMLASTPSPLEAIRR